MRYRCGGGGGGGGGGDSGDSGDSGAPGIGDSAGIGSTSGAGIGVGIGDVGIGAGVSGGASSVGGASTGGVGGTGVGTGGVGDAAGIGGGIGGSAGPSADGITGAAIGAGIGGIGNSDPIGNVIAANTNQGVFGNMSASNIASLANNIAGLFGMGIPSIGPGIGVSAAISGVAALADGILGMHGVDAPGTPGIGTSDPGSPSSPGGGSDNGLGAIGQSAISGGLGTDALQGRGIQAPTQLFSKYAANDALTAALLNKEKTPAERAAGGVGAEDTGYLVKALRQPAAAFKSLV